MNINILIIDPYYSEIQMAIFKSSKIIQVPNQKKYQDIVIKSVMYTTKRNKIDTDFKVQLVTQYPEFLDTRELVEKDFDDEEESEGKDEQESEEEEEENSDSDEYQEKAARFKQESVPLLLDSSNYLYYVTSNEGICSVREINPHNEEKNAQHMVVAEIKSEKCYGLSIVEDDMFFLDDRKVITKLVK